VNQITVSTVGVLLSEFKSGEKGTPLEELIRECISSPQISRGARELLLSSSPSRSRSDGSSRQLIAVEGCFLPKDPHTEAVNRFAEGDGWSKPTLEDALRIFPLISFQGFKSGLVSLVVMHKPVKENILGFTLVDGHIRLTAHKAEPREGWFCRNSGFIFRSK
jgi:hypothetical protein